MRFAAWAMLSAAPFLWPMSQVEAKTLKVAMIEPLSGPSAQTGLAFADAIRFGIKKINAGGGFNNAPVELLEYDNNGQPSVASDKLKEAIARGAQIVVTATSSVVAGQITEDVRRYNLRNPGSEILYYNLFSEAYDLTADKCSFWFFRMGANPYIRMKALIPTMDEQGRLGDRVAIVNQNYSFGFDMQAAMHLDLEKQHKQVVEDIVHDLNKIQDFSPYIARIKESGAQTVITSDWGNDIILMMRAASDAGYHPQFGTTTLDTPGSIGAAGHSALGAYQVSTYSADAGGQAGEAFAEDFKSAVGSVPVSFQATAAFGIQFLGEALKKVKHENGAFATRDLVLALEQTSFQTPVGPLTVRREDHQALLPIVITEVTKSARYKVDGTDMGFQVVAVVPPEKASVPVDKKCQMNRPE